MTGCQLIVLTTPIEHNNQNNMRKYANMLTILYCTTSACSTSVIKESRFYIYPQINAFKLGVAWFKKSQWPLEEQVIANMGCGKNIKTQNGHKRIYPGINCDQIEVLFEVDPENEVSSIIFSGVQADTKANTCITSKSGLVIYDYNYIDTLKSPVRKMEILEENRTVNSYGYNGCRAAKIGENYFREWDDRSSTEYDVTLLSNGKINMKLSWSR